MNNPKAQPLTPELPVAQDAAPLEWTPPQLDKLPVADTTFSGTGSVPDGITFSS